MSGSSVQLQLMQAPFRSDATGFWTIDVEFSVASEGVQTVLRKLLEHRGESWFFGDSGQPLDPVLSGFISDRCRQMLVQEEATGVPVPFSLDAYAGWLWMWGVPLSAALLILAHFIR